MLRVGFSEGIKAHVTTSAKCLWIRQRRVRRPASLLLGAPRWFAVSSRPCSPLDPAPEDTTSPFQRPGQTYRVKGQPSGAIRRSPPAGTRLELLGKKHRFSGR